MTKEGSFLTAVDPDSVRKDKSQLLGSHTPAPGGQGRKMSGSPGTIMSPIGGTPAPTGMFSPQEMSSR